MICQEGTLQIDLQNVWCVCKYDAIPKHSGKKSVDFIIEESDRLLLLEVKDPGTPHERRQKRPLNLKDYFIDKAIPKLTDQCFDSCKDPHPRPRTSKPYDFVVILGVDSYPRLTGPLLKVFRDELHKSIRSKCRDTNGNPLVRNCILVDTRRWTSHFPQFPIKRV